MAQALKREIIEGGFPLLQSRGRKRPAKEMEAGSSSKQFDQEKAIVEAVAAFVDDNQSCDLESTETQVGLLEGAWQRLTELGEAMPLLRTYTRLMTQLKRMKKEGQVQDSPMAGQLYSEVPLENLPKFNGKFVEFANFAERFIIDVHDRANYTNKERLRRLKHCLVGNAETFLDKFKLEDGQYEEAWELLKNTYSGTYESFTCHMQHLLDIPQVKNGDDEAMRKMLSTVEASIERAIDAVKVENFAKAFAVFWIESRFDNRTKEQWRINRGEKEEMPALDDIGRFARLKAKGWAVNNVEKEKEKAAGGLQGKGKGDDRNRGNHEGQKVQGIDGRPRNSISCYKCAGNHSIFKCETFKADPLEKKKQLIKERNLCGCCFAKEHTGLCAKNLKCRICNGNTHNTLLCDQVPKA